MDPVLESNIRFRENDRIPNTPKLSMEVQFAGHVMSLEDPRGFIITIRRAEDDCDEPCIFRWTGTHDAWGPSGFMLFQHTPNGLKRLEGKLESPPPQNLKIDGYWTQTTELLPGQTLGINIGWPSPFWDQLVAGEKYELFWPGAEYALWAWGTTREHLNQEIGVNSGLPSLVIPGGISCSFPCVQAVEPPSDSESEPEDPQVEKSRRIPGTPFISVSLEGPSKVSKGDQIEFTAKITYEGVTNENHEAVFVDAKPIIIHNHGFSHSHFRVQRRSPDFDPSTDSDTDPTQWKTYVDDEQNPGYNIYDGPDVEVSVTNDSHFRCLKPGEDFVSGYLIPPSDLHPDTVAGDTYRYQYWGGYVDWWVWGDREEHANKVVKLPCWLSDRVIDPPDNDGKPGIMVPSSNFVEFSVVE